MDKLIKIYPIDMDLELQTLLRDASYYSGRSRKDIILEGIREKCGELLATFATPAQRADTERQGLTPKPLSPKKVLVKRKVN